VYRFYDLYAVVKTAEPFANDVVVFGFHLGCVAGWLALARARVGMSPLSLPALPPAQGKRAHLPPPPLSPLPPPFLNSALSSSTVPRATAISNLVRDCSMHYVLPKTSLTPLLSQGLLSVMQVAYAYAAWKFAFHFAHRHTAGIRSIQTALGGAASDTLVRGCLCASARCCCAPCRCEPCWLASRICMVCLRSRIVFPPPTPTFLVVTPPHAPQAKIRKDLLAHAFTEPSVRDAFFRNVDAVLFLYNDFAARHEVGSSAAPKEDAEVLSFLKRRYPWHHLYALLLFGRSAVAVARKFWGLCAFPSCVCVCECVCGPLFPRRGGGRAGGRGIREPVIILPLTSTGCCLVACE
jgi:hypothetical protein